MAKQLTLVRVGHLAPHFSILRRVGAPLESLMRRAGLPGLAVDDPDLLVSSHSAYRFCNVASQREGTADLGLRAALETNIADCDWMMRALRHAVTLQDALVALRRLGAGESRHMQLWQQTSGDTAWFCYRGSVPFELAGARQVEQFMVGLFAEWLRKAIGSEWRPSDLSLRGPDDRAFEGHEPFEGTRIRCDQGVTAIGFSSSLLGQPVCEPGILARNDRPAFSNGAGDADLVDALRVVLRSFLPEGVPTIELASRVAGTSVRTLQRELRRSGVTYSELVDGLRRDTALRMMQDPGIKLVDVTFELGFSDAAHFTRAFRRWTGMAPSVFRRLESAQPIALSTSA